MTRMNRMKRMKENRVKGCWYGFSEGPVRANGCVP